MQLLSWQQCTCIWRLRGTQHKVHVNSVCVKNILKSGQMSEKSLFEECQTLIDRGQESWKSYFSKWEGLAKYEEDVPESDLFNESKKKLKSFRRKKVKQPSNQLKPIFQSSVSYRKNQKKRKISTKKRLSLEKKQQVIKAKPSPIDEICVTDMENMELEKILKAVFTQFLKANQNQTQMFTVLSQTFSDREGAVCQFFYRQAQPSYNLTNAIQSASVQNLNCRLINPNSFMENQNLNHNLLVISPNFINRKWEGLKILNEKFKNNLCEQQLILHSNTQLLKPNPQINLEIRNQNRALLPSFSHSNTKLKPLQWGTRLKSPGSICSKINKESFIKRNFLKMNIAHDGKRFRNLCLRKRTNSVTLSMENSNFITPERKPPERKCFSENVLHGKRRRRPSKLFFGNEDEDSESDDQTEKQTPLIHKVNKKPKTGISPKIPDSDSDDCESIFDRVKTP